MVHDRDKLKRLLKEKGVKNQRAAEKWIQRYRDRPRKYSRLMIFIEDLLGKRG